jgi:hypothetical protein
VHKLTHQLNEPKRSHHCGPVVVPPQYQQTKVIFLL